MTGNAYVDITAADDAKVSYTITGTDKADTIVANQSGSTLTGNAGNDTLTGGNGTDIISGGDGTDHIDVSYGTGDKATGGAGNDTYDINAIEVAAVAQVTSGANTVGSATVASGDAVTVTIDGATYTTAYSGNTATAKALNDLFISAHGDSIKGAHGVTVETTGTNDVSLKFTGKADGTSFSADVSFVDDTTQVAVTETTTTTGSAVKDVMTTITDFAAGDILDIDGIVKTTTAKVDGGGGYYEGALSGVTASTEYDVIVVTNTSYASLGDAEEAVSGALYSAGTANNQTDGSSDDVVFVFLNSTTGTSQMYFDVDVDSDNDVDAADLVVTFENLTNLTDLAAAFTADSFVI
jgi:hypothetical protein